jgi:AGZA family xanthine/uracil permease-like MFS transporter
MDSTIAQPAAGAGPLERFFQVAARGSTVRREILAGATTFAAMAYILAVNPAIMSAAGMDRSELVAATALAAIVGSIMMGLLANLPIAVAPAMGSNVIFAFVLVKQMGVPWQAALAVVATTGALFLVLSLSKLRETVARDVPEVLKIGIQAAVGTLIVFIGLRTGGFVVPSPSTLVAMAKLSQPAVILTLVGLLLTPVLLVKKVPGALIISIAVLTLVGFFVPAGPDKYVTQMPASLFAWPKWPAQSFLAFDFGYLASHFLLVLPLLFYFFCAEFFSTLGTLIGVTGAGNLRKPDGSIPNATAAFSTDAVSSMVGPALGTSVVTAFIESVTGVQAGGRTGLTALTVALGFVLSLFLWPVFVIVPAQATAPALVIVGILMMQGLARTDMSDLMNAVPIVSMLLITVLTHNLINGMAVGTLSYILLQVAAGRSREVSFIVWALGVVFIGFFWVTTQI